MLSKIILAVLAILVIAVLYLKLSAVRVSGSDAKALVADGALLLGVRSEGEYANGAVDGSLNIPIRHVKPLDLPQQRRNVGAFK